MQTLHSTLIGMAALLIVVMRRERQDRSHRLECCRVARCVRSRWVRARDTALSPRQSRLDTSVRDQA